jgi:HD-like signal output (HDOD) protein
MPETQRTTPATRIVRTPNFDIRFPPLPRTVADVTKLVAEMHEEPETARLVRIVDSDPVVAGFVLRRINSAYYGVRRRVGDVQKAVHLLGFEEVCDIVLTSGMMRLQDILHSGEQAGIFDQIMRMSVGTASFSKKLASHLDLFQQSSAFTIGLLHTCGRLVLLYNRPDDYEALWCSNHGGFAPTVTSEQIVFGTDHAELGAKAADSWHLPELVVTMIRQYLTPGHIEDHDLRVLALTLAVSAQACERLCLDRMPASARFEPSAALHLLSKAVRMDAAEIAAFVEENRLEVFEYTHSMVDPDA